MQTIPTETPETKDQGQPSFEADDEFQFRRHNVHSQFGDRLQDFQNVRDARRVENFNSSFQVPTQPTQPMQSQPIQSGHISQSPQRLIPMPMVYYYPAGATNQPGAVGPQPYAISPQNMGINFQAMNQFIETQYQDQQPQPYYPSLMPAPSFFPPSSSQEPLPNPLSYNRPNLEPADSRSKRKSFILQRGRRLSLLNQDSQLNDIVSPHKDVHESEFYRYMNNSFAQDLKMKQLMNWCLIRSLRNLESTTAQNGSNSKKISLTILKEFVREIRKGTHDIDWDSEGPELEPTVGNESEINDLFDENKVTAVYSSSSVSSNQLNVKHKPIKLTTIPNEKNIQNEENVKLLKEKIAGIKSEINQWSEDLSNVRITKYHLPSASADVKLPDGLQFTATTEESLHRDLQERLDSLAESTRLLKSTSELLTLTSSARLKKLNECMITKKTPDKSSTKKLLRGLTRSLMQ